MSEKIISINDIITKERQAKGLISTTEIANMLNTSNKVILENAKKLFPNKEFENGKTTFFNEKEISEIIKNIDYDNSQAKEPLLVGKGKIKTELMLKEELQEQIEQAKQLPKQEKLTLALSTFQSLLEDLQKENKEVKQENKDLKDWKTEKLYIENEKYNSKELRVKINRVIRQKAQDFYNNNYKDCWNYYFKLYSDLHCFKGTQNLEMIQDRGHLKEFYNLILNK